MIMVPPVKKIILLNYEYSYKCLDIIEEIEYIYEARQFAKSEFDACINEAADICRSFDISLRTAEIRSVIESGSSGWNYTDTGNYEKETDIVGNADTEREYEEKAIIKKDYEVTIYEEVSPEEAFKWLETDARGKRYLVLDIEAELKNILDMKYIRYIVYSSGIRK